MRTDDTNIWVGGGGIYDVSHIAYPSNLITNTHIYAVAAIAASKLQSFIPLYGRLGGAVVDGAQLVWRYWAKAAGTLHTTLTYSVQVACSGGSAITVDLQVSGVSILTATGSIVSGTSVNTELTLAVDTAAVADGGYIDAVLTGVPSGTDAYGSGIDMQIDFNQTYVA